MKNQRLISLSRNIKPLYNYIHSWSCQIESRIQSILIFKAQEPVVVQASLVCYFLAGGREGVGFCLFGGVCVFFFPCNCWRKTEIFRFFRLQSIRSFLDVCIRMS